MSYQVACIDCGAPAEQRLDPGKCGVLARCSQCGGAEEGAADATIADVIEGRARWCVVQGDAREILPTLPAQSVAHAISDPPYEAEAHTKQRRTLKDATQKRGAVNTGEVRRIEAVLPFDAIDEDTRRAVSVEWGRVVRRWVIAFCQIEAVGSWREALESGGVEWVRGGIWRKPDGVPQFTGDRPGQGFESLAIGHGPEQKRWNNGGNHAVWAFSLDHGHGNGQRNWHPCQKPAALMRKLVEDFTEPDDVVLDCFCGSASTGVACLLTGRRFIGIEREPAYARLAIDRLRAEEQNSTLAAARAGQLPLLAGGHR